MSLSLSLSIVLTLCHLFRWLELYKCARFIYLLGHLNGLTKHLKYSQYLSKFITLKSRYTNSWNNKCLMQKPFDSRTHTDYWRMLVTSVKWISILRWLETRLQQSWDGKLFFVLLSILHTYNLIKRTKKRCFILLQMLLSQWYYFVNDIGRWTYFLAVWVKDNNFDFMKIPQNVARE